MIGLAMGFGGYAGKRDLICYRESHSILRYELRFAFEELCFERLIGS